MPRHRNPNLESNIRKNTRFRYIKKRRDYIQYRNFLDQKIPGACLTVQVSLMLGLDAGNGFYAAYAMGKVSQIIENGPIVVSEVHFD